MNTKCFGCKFLYVFLIVLVSSCNKDDGIMDSDPLDSSFYSIQGTVVTKVSCQTKTGFTYEIKLSEPIETLDGRLFELIGAVNLPTSFQESGTEITFNMKQAKPSDITICVTLYGPNYFYELSDLKLVR